MFQARALPGWATSAPGIVILKSYLMKLPIFIEKNGMNAFASRPHAALPPHRAAAPECPPCSYLEMNASLTAGDNFRYIPFLHRFVKESRAHSSGLHAGESVAPSLRDYAYDTIIDFIRQTVEGSGARGAVIGLSGGIDSALVMKLCCDALGNDRVEALLLPATDVPDIDERDAAGYASLLGVKTRRIPIGGHVSQIAAASGASDAKTVGNIKARVRMIFLYAAANMGSLRVAGTGNKSELLTGYFTKYGDGAVDFLPIGDLYKTEVRQLAVQLKLPSAFLEKSPSAGLWEGQTDEAELGLKYELLDTILFSMENHMSAPEIVDSTGIGRDIVDRIFSMVAAGNHKRRAATMPKIGIRTAGPDW